MDKRFLAIIGVIIVVFIGVATYNNHKSNGGASTGSTSKPTNHVEGNLTSKVTLVEYGDYECPVCESYFSTVQQVAQKYNAQIKFQFRTLPLSQIHPNAFAGARAAEAADLQGKFWQMHDLLYDQNDAYYASNETDSTWINASDPTTFFDQYAAQLG